MTLCTRVRAGFARLASEGKGDARTLALTPCDLHADTLRGVVGSDRTLCNKENKKKLKKMPGAKRCSNLKRA